MTDDRTANDAGSGSLDPGAYIGSHPEREVETIPGGVQPGDERIAAYDSQPGLPQEPADDSWSEGQTGVGDIVQQPAEFDPLIQASAEVSRDEVAEVTPTLGGPLPD